jgi:hypothetical protein
MRIHICNIHIKVLPEDGAISAETYKRKGDNLYICCNVLYSVFFGVSKTLLGYMVGVPTTVSASQPGARGNRRCGYRHGYG